jgi:hypothetical protein
LTAFSQSFLDAVEENKCRTASAKEPFMATEAEQKKHKQTLSDA